MKIQINKKRIIKICTVIVCWVLAIAVLGFEGIIAFRHEVEWQFDDASNIYDDIFMNLDMVQVATQVGDFEMFNNNLNLASERIRDLDKLYMVTNNQHDYIASLKSYLDSLKEKRDFANDVVVLRADLANITSSLKALYGDKTKLTRDTLKSSSSDIVALKLNADKYTAERIKAAVTMTNTMLDNISAKASELAKCIDTCYVDSFTTTNNALSEILKTYSTNISEVNKTIDAEFDFAEITKLKTERFISSL